MPTDCDVFIVRPESPVLEEAFARGVETSFRDAQRPCLLDCSGVRDITPRALAALLELGGRFEPGRLLLSGLSRDVTLLAVQVGLAEHWRIYTSADLLRGRPVTSRAMRALIWEHPDRVGLGALDVAGRPLLLRQLQALRDLGIEDVVVEIAEGEHAAERAAWLLGSDPLCARVQVLPSAGPLGVEELAQRAGLPRGELFLSIRADLAFHAALDLSTGVPTRHELAAPRSVHEAPVQLELRTCEARAAEEDAPLASGWGMRVTGGESAHALACAALEGHAPGFIVHAAQVRPGVWFARGARVAPDAQLHPPVLVGSHARVFANAQVGPRAIVGHACVVEPEAVITDSSVAARVLVGEGTRIAGAHAEAHRIVSFADGSVIEVRDPLVLTSRETGRTALSSRLAALGLCILLALPWLLGTTVQRLSGRPPMRALKTRRGSLHIGESGFGFLDLFPALIDVLLGRRDLVGVSDRRALEEACTVGHDSLRPGAFDLSPAMAPGASTATLLRMWRWYRAHKSSALDRTLWRQRALQAQRKPERFP